MAQKTTKDYLYVGIQFVLFLAFAWSPPFLGFARGEMIGYLGLLIGAVAAIGGLASIFLLRSALSPFPTPVSGGVLVTTGLYAYARHPIYTSVLLAAFGYGVYSGSGYRLLIGLALLVLFYFKSAYEEERLKAQYPDYPAYRQKVGRFSPWF
ncbi:MAG: isoprenylcysteine carboxylmethyltransferase family protein [Bacteroidota bacterium]